MFYLSWLSKVNVVNNLGVYKKPENFQIKEVILQLAWKWIKVWACFRRSIVITLDMFGKVAADRQMRRQSWPHTWQDIAGVTSIMSRIKGKSEQTKHVILFCFLKVQEGDMAAWWSSFMCCTLFELLKSKTRSEEHTLSILSYDTLNYFFDCILSSDDANSWSLNPGCLCSARPRKSNSSWHWQNENTGKALPNFPAQESDRASVLGLVSLETRGCAHGQEQGCSCGRGPWGPHYWISYV